MRTVLCTKVVSQKLFPFLKGTQRFFASYATDLLSPTLLTRRGSLDPTHSGRLTLGTAKKANC